MQNLEKNLYENREQLVVIKKSSDAPKEVKDNSFYDSETWGWALSPDDIYLPDCDEAMSFAIAAHEIGHLSNEDEIDEKEITQDNFKGTRREEERAWRVGKKYINKCVEKYYIDDEDTKKKIEQAIEKIEKLIMDQVDLSKSMYLEAGSLDSMNEGEKETILKQKREELYDGDAEKEISEKQKEIKEQKIGKKTDWDKFTVLIKQAVEKIVEDNKKRV